MTRAQCQVVAHWAPTRNTPTAPLHRLLLGAPEPGGGRPATVAVPSDAAAQQALEAVAQASGGTVVDRAGGARTAAALGAAAGSAVPALAVSRFTRTLDTAWRRTSYSALTRDAHDAPPVASEPEAPGTVDEPDVPVADLALAPAGSPASPLGGLPGGTAFGTLVHEVLEDLDPAALDAPVRGGGGAPARQPGRGASARRRAAARAAHAARLAGAWRSPTSPRATGCPSWSSSCRSPAATTPSPRRPSPTSPPCCGRHDLGPLAGYPERLAGLEPQQLRGFLTGSIDALLRLPGPRYVVVDYKTNRLGPDPLTAWHYRPEAMAEEMLRAHYPLQALLYAVAVHRYLRWRQPGYDPADPPRRRAVPVRARHVRAGHAGRRGRARVAPAARRSSPSCPTCWPGLP